VSFVEKTRDSASAQIVSVIRVASSSNEEAMMIGKALLAVGATFALAGAANAHSISVLGNNADAAACFRAADSDMRRPDAVDICSAALRSTDLSRYDQMATLVNRGIVRFRIEDFDGAIADFDAAMEIEPNQPDAMINRGITMLASGEDIDSSLRFIDGGLARHPQRPWVGYYGRAVANELAGRDSAAYYDYRRALELQPRWDLPRQALARFTVRQ
jgi:tetratricopeptide (TPR) repeat protein